MVPACQGRGAARPGSETSTGYTDGLGELRSASASLPVPFMDPKPHCARLDFQGDARDAAPALTEPRGSVAVAGFSASLPFGPSRAFSIASPWALGRGSFRPIASLTGPVRRGDAVCSQVSPWLQEGQTPVPHQGNELGPATLPCGLRQVALAGLSLPILKLDTRGTFPGSPVVRIPPFLCRGHGFNSQLGN